MVRKHRAITAAAGWLSVAALAPILLVAGCATQSTTTTSTTAGVPVSQTEQQQLVDASQKTVSDFIRDPDMTWLQRHFPEARGVLVAPMIVKAGFIFGGSGGRAVLFTRNDRTGRWDGPAFYNVGAASVGFQAGVSVAETLTLVMTEKGINTLLAPSFKLGGDVSVATGPVGAGANADVTTDFIAFSRTKGLYGGLNLEGSVIDTNGEWNRTYYGRDVTTTDIIVRADVRNPNADRLAAELSRAANRQRTSSAQ